LSFWRGASFLRLWLEETVCRYGRYLQIC
jgi:hypothetical protein